jgi:hypothetical protein
MFRKVVILLLAAACTTAVVAKGRSKPRERSGSYNFTVAGFVRGTGTATVAGDKLKIEADVALDAGGATGELNASNLTIINNHFRGPANVMGELATIEGRIDVPDSDIEKAIRGVRLSAMVRTDTTGRYAKLIGYMPSQASVKDRIDEEDEQEKSKGKSKK